MSRTFEEQQLVEYRRQQVVEQALSAADRIILDGSDGTCEETNFLTAQVAEKMMTRALLPFLRDMMRKDLED